MTLPDPTVPPATTTRGHRGVAGILASNALTLALALWQGWSIHDLLWPFWIQSLVIGWYARERLLLAPRLAVHTMHINGRPVSDPEQARRFMGWFFLAHFGLFHLVYAVFLAVLPAFFDSGGGSGLSLSKTGLFLLSGIAFWMTHRASHRAHVRADLAHPRSIALLMAMPYLRIVPMHLTILVAAFAVVSGTVDPSTASIAVFVALKTAADLGTHLLEHRLLQNAPRTGGGNRPA